MVAAIRVAAGKRDGDDGPVGRRKQIRVRPERLAGGADRAGEPSLAPRVETVVGVRPPIEKIAGRVAVLSADRPNPAGRQQYLARLRAPAGRAADHRELAFGVGEVERLDGSDVAQRARGIGAERDRPVGRVRVRQQVVGDRRRADGGRQIRIHLLRHAFLGRTEQVARQAERAAAVHLIGMQRDQPDRGDHRAHQREGQHDAKGRGPASLLTRARRIDDLLRTSHGVSARGRGGRPGGRRGPNDAETARRPTDCFRTHRNADRRLASIRQASPNGRRRRSRHDR